MKARNFCHRVVEVDPKVERFLVSLKIAPSSLVNCEQRSALVLRIVANNNTHEEGQADHATQEDINVNIDGVSWS
jgi:hypothetical protein